MLGPPTGSTVGITTEYGCSGTRSRRVATGAAYRLRGDSDRLSAYAVGRSSGLLWLSSRSQRQSLQWDRENRLGLSCSAFGSLALVLAQAHSSYSLQFSEDRWSNLADTSRCLGATRGPLRSRDLAEWSLSLIRYALRQDPDFRLANYLMVAVSITIDEHKKADQACRDSRRAGRPCPDEAIRNIVRGSASGLRDASRTL